MNFPVYKRPGVDYQTCFGLLACAPQVKLFFSIFAGLQVGDSMRLHQARFQIHHIQGNHFIMINDIS